MQSSFQKLSESLFARLDDGEQLTLNFHGEKTLFIRFNKAKVRQASDVLQQELKLTLKCLRKESSITIPLGGSAELDARNAEDSLILLRQRLNTLEPPAFFVGSKNNGTSNTVNSIKLPSAEEYLALIAPEIACLDLAGLLSSGTTCIGNANSLGQWHWFESASFCFDYSLYTEKEKAVKSAYSGSRFCAEELRANLVQAKEFLQLMAIPNRVLPPGKYNCYLAPAAVNEILGTFNWGGTSQSGLKRGSSPLLPMEDEGKKLSALFTLREDFSLGLHPSFNGEGEVADQSTDIFDAGTLINLLVSSKTAQEFELTSNRANTNESMRSPVIQSGKLKKQDILKTLDNGIYISNLHYLNWSDLVKGRMTGMTRFACFLVEKGEIVSPIQDLRFDETLYNFWGDNLLAVSDFTETAVETDTYSKRSLGGTQCPGMLIKDFNFTL